ncbi:hypothetical protein IAD21_06389 (plasmid) [Abditibacteriota bacterium]|nr:hypothetical protein IAD21_06389 [Abditibacteriota bacterium]
MRPETPKKNPAEIRDAIADIVFGSDEEIAQDVLAMSDKQISTELAEAGIDTNSSFEALRARLQAAVAQRQVGVNTAVEQTTPTPSLPFKDLSDARNAKKWTVGQLAKELDIPKELALKLVRGYDQWSSRLTTEIARIFALTLAQASQLLANTNPAPATQFKATRQPETPSERGKSFQEDLEEFARQGKLTAEQRRKWLQEEDEK